MFKHHWKYQNTLLLIVSIIIFLFLADTPFVHYFINKIGEWGYLGAVITGIFLVFTFTTAPSLVILYNLAENLNPVELSLLAGVGSVLGDFIIFNFFKDKVFVELEPIVTKLSKRPFMHIFHTPYFAWLSPVLGALIIASPLPDELGITLLSTSKLKKWHFVVLSFLLNSVGIWLIITAAEKVLH